jgi:hypothetical protein
MGTMETTTRKYTINDVGCYGEGLHGIYLGQHVMEIALSHGMDIEPIGPHCLDSFLANDRHRLSKLRFTAEHAEEYDYRTDVALNWLNANMVEDDVFFEFFDGEFFLSSIHQEEEENFLV